MILYNIYPAVRAVDPYHLIMGCRFADLPSAPILAACGEYHDVASMNYYADAPTTDLVNTLGTNSKKPVIIGKFSFRGAVSVYSHFVISVY